MNVVRGNRLHRTRSYQSVWHCCPTVSIKGKHPIKITEKAVGTSRIPRWGAESTTCPDFPLRAFFPVPCDSVVSSSRSSLMCSLRNAPVDDYSN
ncbi:hypothetical protein Q8A67_003486 [Cirrhinus molitorella]|uniref:Uncharacterized protein n=1 Tax=Cirrhinus molitorella TaxID=172907 RepID=A0AA88Q586_9TELE|nr:hypothetical protein Q8A67_003486 [Cirrhinus molitorella]